MREPSREELINTAPPELRMSSKTVQAYLDLRRKILNGSYEAGQVLIPKNIEEEYQVNNTSTQILLMRLANEGLVNILPIKARSWPSNASLNEYRVADLSTTHKLLADRRQAALPNQEHLTKETLLLKIQYADAEIAPLLAMAPGERVIAYRERLRDDQQTVIAISDSYLPFWFAEMLPELEQSDRDIYQLMREQGKQPASWTETIEVVLARSTERVLFELSPDDPAPLMKVQRQTFDLDGNVLTVHFLTARVDRYRLRYGGV